MSFWTIEQSHVVDHPETVGHTTTEELISWVRHRAAQPRKYPHQRAFGPLDIELLENGQLIRTFFRDKNGRRKRFMRLRRS